MSTARTRRTGRMARPAPAKPALLRYLRYGYEPFFYIERLVEKRREENNPLRWWLQSIPVKFAKSRYRTRPGTYRTSRYRFTRRAA